MWLFFFYFKIIAKSLRIVIDTAQCKQVSMGRYIQKLCEIQTNGEFTKACDRQCTLKTQN